MGQSLLGQKTRATGEKLIKTHLGVPHDQTLLRIGPTYVGKTMCSSFKACEARHWLSHTTFGKGWVIVFDMTFPWSTIELVFVSMQSLLQVLFEELH